MPNPSWRVWATLISWMKTVNFCLTRRWGTILKVTGVLILLQLMLIKFTAVSDSCGSLRGASWKLNCSVCALFLYLSSTFCLGAPFTPFAVRKAPSCKILQPVSGFKNLENELAVQNWHFSFKNTFKNQMKAALYSHKCYGFPTGDRGLHLSHHLRLDQKA